MVNKVPESLRVFCGTWNVNELDPSSKVTRSLLCTHLISWLGVIRNPMCDVYVIGFQEIQMDASSLIREETDMKVKWRATLSQLFELVGRSYSSMQIKKEGVDPLSARAKVIQKECEFLCAFNKQLVGLYLTVFVRSKKWTKNLRSEGYSIVREGKLGLGNKGAIIYRFKLFDRSFIFINCHLTAHMKNEETRNKNLNNIMATTMFVRSSKITIEDHEYIVLLGDFNYRIAHASHDPALIISRIEKFEQYREDLLSYDQLSFNKLCGNILPGFNEGGITFKPTFKFHPGTEEYNEKRVPSWTDRIFYKSINDDLQVKLLKYTSTSSMKFSDHKPVHAIFEFSMTESSNRQRGPPPPPLPRRRKSGRKKLPALPPRVKSVGSEDSPSSQISSDDSIISAPPRLKKPSVPPPTLPSASQPVDPPRMPKRPAPSKRASVKLIPADALLFGNIDDVNLPEVMQPTMPPPPSSESFDQETSSNHFDDSTDPYEESSEGFEVDEFGMEPWDEPDKVTEPNTESSSSANDTDDLIVFD